jgi:hypothetical protein
VKTNNSDFTWRKQLIVKKLTSAEINIKIDGRTSVQGLDKGGTRRMDVDIDFYNLAHQEV